MFITHESTVAMAGVALATRRTMARALIVAGIMAGGWAGSIALEKMLNLTFDKPPMPLTKPLSEMSKQIGTDYVAQGPDEVLDDETIDTLGTKDYLLRTYTDLTKSPGEVGTSLKLNLNYYATGNASPHVPEICWAGAGKNEAPESRRYFVVPGVRRRDGSVVDLRMRMISFLPPKDLEGSVTVGSAGASRLLNVAYLFEVNGNCVATPQEVSSSFWVASLKHAYHTKIEVTVPEYCTQEEAMGVIKKFMTPALAEVEACLPVAEGKEKTEVGSQKSEKDGGRDVASPIEGTMEKYSRGLVSGKSGSEEVVN